MTLDDAPDVLTVAEAARLLRTGKNQAYELVRTGQLHGRRIGRGIRIPKSALVAFLEGKPTTDRVELKVI